MIALDDLFGQIALHQAEPVAISCDFVGGIDGGDAVFAVHDGGKCSLDPDIGQSGGIRLADQGGAVDQQVDQQAVDAQQDLQFASAIGQMARKLCRVLQPAGAPWPGGDKLPVFHRQGGQASPSALFQGGHRVQMRTAPGDDPRATGGIIGFGGGQIAQCVGAIERVIQAAPAGVGGVERIAGVHDGNNKLRAGNQGDFRINPGGGDLEIGTFGHQIADGGEKGLIGVCIERFAALRDMPRIDL